MKRCTPFVLGLMAAAFGLTGCTTAPSQQHAAAEPLPTRPVRITTLAAADSLGGLVFASDVALGPTIDGTRPVYAEVPTR